jgi:hypothetical protein
MPDFNLIKVDKSDAVQQGDATMMTITSQPGPQKIWQEKAPSFSEWGFV